MKVSNKDSQARICVRPPTVHLITRGTYVIITAESTLESVSSRLVQKKINIMIKFWKYPRKCERYAEHNLEGHCYVQKKQLC